MSEVAEKAAEVVAENVEGVIDGTVEVLEVVRNNPKVLAAAGILGLVAGGVGGYFIAKEKLRKFYEDLATQEIEEAKSFYSDLYKVDADGEALTPQSVMIQRHGEEAAAEALRTYQGMHEAIDALQNGGPELAGEPHDEVVDEAHIRKMEASIAARAASTEKSVINVFVDTTFDVEEEVKYRTEDKPYIITHDEYFAAEKDYDMVSLTYFETDDTLVDEQDKPVEDSDKVVGDEHLARFGSGSKDRNIVYVRNDRLGIDYEIVKSKGSYLEEVLGMPDEEPGTLKHSDTRDRRRAFRHGEE